jgi:hypothetical protein
MFPKHRRSDRQKSERALTLSDFFISATAGNALGTRPFYTISRTQGEKAMKQTNHNGNYDSYLLKIWRGESGTAWRWMLQNIRTGEQKGFRDIETLVQFLDLGEGETRIEKREMGDGD